MIGRVNHKEVICIHLGSAQVGRRLIKQAENPSIEPAALATVKNTFISLSKWFWVAIEGYLSYLLPKFEDLVPTS